ATITKTGGGSVSPGSAASSASGIAVTYTAPASSTDGSSTVTATYKGFTASSTITTKGITFTLSPASATVDADGQSTVGLTLTSQYTTAGTALPSSTAVAVSPVSVGSVSPTSASAVTTAVTFTAAAQTANTSGSVTATYKGLTATTTLTLRTVLLSLSPSPASIPADGVITSAVSATLTIGGGAGAQGWFSFSRASAAPPGTRRMRTARVTLRAPPASKTTTTPSVTASYGGQSALRSVTLTGITMAEPTEVNTVSGSGTNRVYWTPPGTGYSNGV